MNKIPTILAICLTAAASFSCSTGVGAKKTGSVVDDGPVVVGHELAKESVLRAIPTSHIDAARTGLHIAYQHTSHGSHVSCGLFGLQDYKEGDSVSFGVSTSGESGKLDFQDNSGWGGTYSDLSQADTDWSAWVDQVRTYLDDPANSEINVMMWSWCDISTHDVAGGYLPSMQILIGEYGEGGSKIGTGAGKTRIMPVAFIFMTGHAYTDNVGDGRPKNQADLITAYCEAHGHYCLDYYSIDSHDMDGDYYADASDDAYSTVYGGNFNRTWQDAHTRGVDWYANLGSPGGSEDFGAHLSQHITANRKAYAMWYILARIAGWGGA